MPRTQQHRPHGPAPTRFLDAAITYWVAVSDVARALGCGRTTAYAHLRRAAGRRPGDRGLLRVPAPVWERYAAEHLGPRSGNCAEGA